MTKLKAVLYAKFGSESVSRGEEENRGADVGSFAASINLERGD